MRRGEHQRSPKNQYRTGRGSPNQGSRDKSKGKRNTPSNHKVISQQHKHIPQIRVPSPNRLGKRRATEAKEAH